MAVISDTIKDSFPGDKKQTNKNKRQKKKKKKKKSVPLEVDCTIFHPYDAPSLKMVAVEMASCTVG